MFKMCDQLKGEEIIHYFVISFIQNIEILTTNLSIKFQECVFFLISINIF